MKNDFSSAPLRSLFNACHNRLRAGQGRLLRTALLSLLSCIFIKPAALAGITVTPLSDSLDPITERSRLITVRNRDVGQATPVKVSVWAWTLSEQGQDIREPTSDLIVFPGQFLLEAGGRHAIRIALRNPKLLTSRELSYRVLVEELPVEVVPRTPRTGIKFLTSYAAAFYVKPENPYSDVQIVDVVRQDGALLIKLFNRGNAHTHLFELALTLSQGSQTAKFDVPEHLGGAFNANVLTNSERHFVWYWPTGVTKTIDLRRPFRVQLMFNCEYCETAQTALTYSVD